MAKGTNAFDRRAKREKLRGANRAAPTTLIDGVEFSTPFWPLLDEALVKVQCGPYIWNLPRGPLIRTSKLFQQQLSGDDTQTRVQIPEHSDPDTVTLFAEWLLTDRYREESYYVLWCSGSLNQPKGPLHDPNPERTATWAQKACIWAWVLGYQINSPGFMNYAMQQVLRLWWHSTPWGYLNPHAAKYACTEIAGRPSKLKELVYQMVIARWGDLDFINSKHEGWLDFFEENPDLNIRFLSEVGKCPEQRMRQGWRAIKLHNFLESEEKQDNIEEH
ncbi:hypothetical protein GQ43DRAFT_484945 [Delitschia confertaspora ATCC 74209]|uniref:BTB domain-containing protein n=1 Tax=Delitschia confertaspora ATCC 74209 TaxID=1513339 RepID=A0A9P4JBX8_9PLEO|nr:hypothetical protein GQ43DRAFT_484945 [Delitschia confertaspora ATCC 74209]